MAYIKPQKNGRQITYEMLAGLEVHVELTTASKAFCGCANLFGASPNTHVCPVCAGLPGSLPVLNQAVLEYAVKTGLALECDVAGRLAFDRKHYFYADLPKGYQITQFTTPICQRGALHIESEGQSRAIGIRELHIEEDAGKLLHDGRTGEAFLDLNRCGVPLLEIVSEPDFRSAEEIVAYLEKLRETLLFLGVSDCKLQQGSMRVDVNLSVRPQGSEAPGTRTEMKNMNSFRAIRRAVRHETERQIQMLAAGGWVTQETRRWDDASGMSYAMRRKESAGDYRYCPEPDLPPVLLDEDWVSAVARSLPEPACRKRQRYVAAYGLAYSDAVVLTSHPKWAQLFEEAVDQGAAPREAAGLMVGELPRLCGAGGREPEEIQLQAGGLACLTTMMCTGVINRGVAKQVLERMFFDGTDPAVYVEQNGLQMVEDGGRIAAAVERALRENFRSVADYRAGKKKAFGFLMGQVMGLLEGKASPQLVRAALSRQLDSQI